MASSLLSYTAAARSDRGRKRSTNEDAYGLSLEHGVFLVCDGMGGAAAGEVASAMAVDEVMRLLTQRGSEQPVEDAARTAITAANEAIYTRSQRHLKLRGMGTTLVALVAEPGQAWMVNVGDSRGYCLRDGRLTQVTVDHSLVDEQVRSGRMNEADARRSPLRNVITRALGTQPFVTPDIFPLRPEPGDVFLLCSDGLTREVSDLMLQSLLSLDLSPDEI